MEELNSVDLNAIATSLFPDIAPAVVERMIHLYVQLNSY